jgi:hypothetical protein
MRLPVKTGSPENEGVRLITTGETKQVIIRTCEDYYNYRNKGFFASDNFNIKMSAFFEQTCGLIKSLKTATVASQSYISELGVSINTLDLMPISLLPNFNPDFQAQIDAHPDSTIQDWINDGTITLYTAIENGFKIEFHYQGVIMRELFRADLNNDGNEDILVFYYNYAIGGTLGYGSTCRITRRTAKTKFELLL